VVAGFLLGASSTGKLATSLSPAAGREQAPLGDALQLAGAEHLPYATGGEPQNLRGLIDGVEVLLHMDSIPLPEAFALVRGSGVSFSRWCSCGVLSLMVHSGVWGIGEFAYLLSEEMELV
jgi:hypothetical protein